MASPTTDAPILEAPLPAEVLSQLYSHMLKARLLEKRFRTSARWSEAVLGGTIANAEDADLFVASGEQPLLAALTGTPSLASKRPSTSNGASSEDSRVIVCGSDAASAIASGLALAIKSNASSAVVIAFLSATSTRGAAWEQATEFAAANRLPMVFICDGTAARSPRSHDGKALSHWPFPTIAVDGRDVIAVYRVTKEAISAARRGHGPTLVDCVNYVAPGKRGKDLRDPLASFRGYLKRHNAWFDAEYRALETRLSSEIPSR